MLKVINERTVYNLLNLIADIGGFTSPVFGLGMFLGHAYGSLAFVTHIIEAVFLTKKLKPFKFIYSSILAGIATKQRKLWQRGKLKIENELDIVKFVQHQYLM